MADLVFNQCLFELDRFVWASTPLDIRSLLLVTADTDQNMREADDIAALEATAAAEATTMTSYGRITHTSETLVLTDASNIVDFGADDAAFGVVGNGANQTTTDIVVFSFITSDALSVPVSFHDAVFLSDGSAVTVEWNSGVMWRAAGA